MNGSADSIPVLPKVLVIVLSITNGMYYGRRVIASWAVHELEAKSKDKEPRANVSEPSQPRVNPLDQKLEATSWKSFGFSPQTRLTIAESMRESTKLA